MSRTATQVDTPTRASIIARLAESNNETLERWRIRQQIRALEILLAGEPLTAERLHHQDEPPHPSYWGSLFRTGLLRTVMKASDVPARSSLSGNWVDVWVLKPDAVELARELLRALKNQVKEQGGYNR